MPSTSGSQCPVPAWKTPPRPAWITPPRPELALSFCLYTLNAGFGLALGPMSANTVCVDSTTLWRPLQFHENDGTAFHAAKMIAVTEDLVAAAATKNPAKSAENRCELA
jgi:hypothetical protein